MNTMENQEMPPFIKYINETNTITMTPNSLLFQGRTYYFSVVLKERNSDFMMNIYYMTVKINGDPVDPDDLKPPPKLEVSMSLAPINYKSQGQLSFSMGVNPWIFSSQNKSLFWEIFDVYVINTVREREAIIDIDFEVVSNNTVNYTVKFQHPYMYGLLNKKSDNLVFRAKNLVDENLLGLLVLN